ncbi:hypothetical protein KCU73_g9570, partial [Aureobasidium melanogenum]
MSTISTDAASITTSASQLAEKPSEDNMIVSITRHRRSPPDTTYTYQFPYFLWGTLDEEAFLARLKNTLRDRLQGNAADTSLVWRMSETGQIAFVRSKNSLTAALFDHKNANKKIIQLFAVSNDNIHCLPGLDFSK